MMEDGPRPLSRSCTWNGITSSSTLLDSYEIRAINQSLKQAPDEPSSTVDNYPSLDPTTVQPQIHAWTPSIRRSTPLNGASTTLCDSYEIHAINQSLEQAMHHSPLPNKASSTADNHPSLGPTTNHHQVQARTPLILRSSPRSGQSTLCDSYELMTVAHQLNRALHAEKKGSPWLGCLASPLYVCRRRCMEHLKKESAKTPKRVTCGSMVIGRPTEGKGGEKGGKGGIVPRLWRKLKRSLLWRKSLG